MAIPDGKLGETIECCVDPHDTLYVGSTEYAGDPVLYVMAERDKEHSRSIYMDREKVEELATYLMYWLHKTKNAE